jgi:cold shock protein
MPTERVKFFNEGRGDGFIVPADGGPDVFVHVHEIEAPGMKMLVAGPLVAYEVGGARDGRSKAVNLRLVHPERRNGRRAVRSYDPAGESPGLLERTGLEVDRVKHFSLLPHLSSKPVTGQFGSIAVGDSRRPKQIMSG